jgi:hypothetical protein
MQPRVREKQSRSLVGHKAASVGMTFIMLRGVALQLKLAQGLVTRLYANQGMPGVSGCADSEAAAMQRLLRFPVQCAKTHGLPR